MFGIASAWGSALFLGGWTQSERAVGTSISLAVLVLVDLGRLWSGRQTSACVNRQTPQMWRNHGALGVFGWGVDTGTPISTIRVSEGPAVGTILLVWGFAPWWVGLVYAGGIVFGVLLSLRQLMHVESMTAVSLPDWMIELRGKAMHLSGLRMLIPGFAAGLASIGVVVAS